MAPGLFICTIASLLFDYAIYLALGWRGLVALPLIAAGLLVSLGVFDQEEVDA